MKIPSLVIFTCTAAMCLIAAALSGYFLFLFMFAVAEDSIGREGGNQADEVGARVSASILNIVRARNETANLVLQLGRAGRLEPSNGTVDGLNSIINATFYAPFLTKLQWGGIEGLECTAVLPKGSATNASIRHRFARTQMYYDPLKQGGRVYTYSPSDSDGINISRYRLSFRDEDPNSPYISHLSGFRHDDETNKFYQGVAYPSESMALYAWAGPDGFPYFYLSTYTVIESGGYMFYVAADQIITEWYDLIFESIQKQQLLNGIGKSVFTEYLPTLKGTDSVNIVIVDGITGAIVASSYRAEFERISKCYNSSDEINQRDETCFGKSYKENPNADLRAIIGSVASKDWEDESVSIAPQFVKRSFDQGGRGKEEYYVLTKLLSSGRSGVRPILIWAQASKPIATAITNVTVVVVVAACGLILLSLIFMSVSIGCLLLRPLKSMQSAMDKLTSLETDEDDLRRHIRRMERDDSEADTDEDDDAFFSKSPAAPPPQQQKKKKDRKKAPRKTAAELDEEASMTDGSMNSVTSASEWNESDNSTANTENKKKREDEGSTPETSIISEIHKLQTHFNAMSKALLSFSRYVPKDVVRDLVASGSLAKSGMHTMNITILFADIRGFTTMCEMFDRELMATTTASTSRKNSAKASKSTAKATKLLTLFFQRNTERLLVHGATIDKFIGDCIMSFWGAPLRINNPNFRAVCAGLDVIHTTRQISNRFERFGIKLEVRVGAHTGTCLVGNIGSASRINYTAIGDPVNIASRLEGLGKDVCANFTVSEDMLQEWIGIETVEEQRVARSGTLRSSGGKPSDGTASIDVAQPKLNSGDDSSPSSFDTRNPLQIKAPAPGYEADAEERKNRNTREAHEGTSQPAARPTGVAFERRRIADLFVFRYVGNVFLRGRQRSIAVVHVCGTRHRRFPTLHRDYRRTAAPPQQVTGSPCAAPGNANLAWGAQARTGRGGRTMGPFMTSGSRLVQPSLRAQNMDDVDLIGQMGQRTDHASETVFVARGGGRGAPDDASASDTPLSSADLTLFGSRLQAAPAGSIPPSLGPSPSAAVATTIPFPTNELPLGMRWSKKFRADVVRTITMPAIQAAATRTSAAPKYNHPLPAATAIVEFLMELALRGQGQGGVDGYSSGSDFSSLVSLPSSVMGGGTIVRASMPRQADTTRASSTSSIGLGSVTTIAPTRNDVLSPGLHASDVSDVRANVFTVIKGYNAVAKNARVDRRIRLLCDAFTAVVADVEAIESPMTALLLTQQGGGAANPLVAALGPFFAQQLAAGPQHRNSKGGHFTPPKPLGKAVVGVSTTSSSPVTAPTSFTTGPTNESQPMQPIALPAGEEHHDQHHGRTSPNELADDIKALIDPAAAALEEAGPTLLEVVPTGSMSLMHPSGQRVRTAKEIEDDLVCAIVGDDLRVLNLLSDDPERDAVVPMTGSEDEVLRTSGSATEGSAVPRPPGARIVEFDAAFQHANRKGPAPRGAASTSSGANSGTTAVSGASTSSQSSAAQPAIVPAITTPPQAARALVEDARAVLSDAIGRCYANIRSVHEKAVCMAILSDLDRRWETYKKM